MKTVILAGSGHAHLEVIKALSPEEIVNHRFLLVSPSRQTFYSGLIPRLIAGEINENSLTINSADFAEKKGFQFIQASVLSVDQTTKNIELSSGEKISYDLLSLNIGGSATPVPTESPFSTIYLRPFDDFLPKWREIQRICSACVSPRFIVVGGGAAAVEVATALRIKLRSNQAPKGEVHLFSKSARLCESYSEKISTSIKKSLLDQGIVVHLNQPVNQIFDKSITLSGGEKLDFDSLFMVTPTRPSTILPGKVDAQLRLSESIFAVGDGTEMAEHPHLPRSGVIAVHQGRHLAKNIRALLSDSELLSFPVKSKQLNILISGKNSARLVWGNWSYEGRWPLQLKNWIDQRYMNGFND